MLELQGLRVACGTCCGHASWVWVGFLGGAAIAFSSTTPARLLWVRADLAVLRLARWSQCFPGAGPGWSMGLCMEQLSAFASAGRAVREEAGGDSSWRICTCLCDEGCSAEPFQKLVVVEIKVDEFLLCWVFPRQNGGRR